MNMALTSLYLSHFISEIRKTIASPTSKGHFGNGIRELLKHFSNRKSPHKYEVFTSDLSHSKWLYCL